jgi:pimeloyl-ACP methyl ester carboxylesterase
VVEEAKDTLALLDHLGVERAFFVGTSRGGIISMVTATMAKERMLGVVLNDVGPEIGAAGWTSIMGYVGIRPQAKDYDAAAEAMAERMAGQFPGVPVSRWRVCVERWFSEGPDGLELRYDPALRDTLLAQSDKPAPDLWPLFVALDVVPLGLIRGANSDLLTEETADAMRARRPDLGFALVPDRGHTPFLDEAESLARIRAMIAGARP